MTGHVSVGLDKSLDLALAVELLGRVVVLDSLYSLVALALLEAELLTVSSK